MRSVFCGGRLLRAGVLLGLTANAAAQGIEPPALLAPIPADTIRNSSAVVATVGPVSITAREFFFSYVFGPAFVKRGEDSKRRHLEYMVNEKLLALAALARGADRDPRVTANLRELAGDFASEELYREDILAPIHVSDEDVERGVQQQAVLVSMQWIFADTEEGAAAVDDALRVGTPFDTLFERQFAGPAVSRDERSMENTLFQILRHTPVLASVLDTLPPGVPSQPVRGPDGWYIVRIENVTRAAIRTESALAERRENVRRALVQRRADSVSAGYVQAIMLEADPVIQRRTFDILRAFLGWKYLSTGSFEAWEIAGRFRRGKDSVEYRHPEVHGHEELVQLRRGSIKLAQFLRWFAMRESAIALRPTSPQSFFVELEDLIWRMVRDHLLVERARSRGYGTDPAVLVQTGWWRDKFLYQVEKDSLLRTIEWTDSTLREYHAQHPRLFRDQNGGVRSFDEAREDVLREWHTEALSRLLLHRLAGLKRQFPVAIHGDVLRQVPVDDEQDPRAIDVYTVKKGGTFPRPAFATIDPFWRAWQ